ncbi:MAG TPA: hypothetical protein VI299_26175, partial [Polyangiales bacterium]
MSALDPWSLATRGDAPALIDAASGELVSYRALHQRVTALAAQLAGERTLVFVACKLDVASIVAYLAALAAGHAVYLFDADLKLRVELEARYRPGFVVEGERVEQHAVNHALHPALQL